MTEENIQKNIIDKFGLSGDKIKIQRKRRVTVEVSQADFQKVLEFAIKDLKFLILLTISGLDTGSAFEFIYHMAREDGIILNIKISTPRETPIIKTVTNIFPSADAYERELVDLLGAKVEGLAEGKRYPLPDDWPVGEYPLRKDWKAKPSKLGEV